MEQLKLVKKTEHNHKSIFKIKNCIIGSDKFIVMAGPCSIESRTQIFNIAAAVAKSGATILRGGAFKPRTSPYDFQGLGEIGLKFMREACDHYNLLCVSEVMAVEDLHLVAQYVDILQIGARNMQNFSLLKAAGSLNKPILLKRGLCATYKEFLLAAEYILSHGNSEVILCERGIRTYETYTRNTLDLAAIPILRELTHLPIIVDPSHGVGIRSIVAPMSCAAVAVKADGLIIEVHTDPDQSISDPKQTISTDDFCDLMKSLQKIATAVCLTI